MVLSSWEGAELALALPRRVQPHVPFLVPS